MERLKNKIAVITGASSGIGAEISELFASEGANVVVNYLSSNCLLYTSPSPRD